MTDRSKTRSAARLAAVQALYQMEMESTPPPAAPRIPPASPGRHHRGRDLSSRRGAVLRRCGERCRCAARGDRCADREQARQRLDAGASRQADAADPARRHLASCSPAPMSPPAVSSANMSTSRTPLRQARSRLRRTACSTPSPRQCGADMSGEADFLRRLRAMVVDPLPGA